MSEQEKTTRTGRGSKCERPECENIVNGYPGQRFCSRDCGRSSAGRARVARRRRSLVGTCQGPSCDTPIYGYANKRFCSNRCAKQRERLDKIDRGLVLGKGGRVVGRASDDRSVILYGGDRSSGA